jgi:hypothetical protein
MNRLGDPDVDIKIKFKEIGHDGVNWILSGSGLCPGAGCCEHGNETLSSIKGERETS